jgi:type IX secretion system PorP/SprF family membrane protein
MKESKKHIIRFHLIFIALLWFATDTDGQDRHFSQFYNNRVYHNPAAASLQETDYRIGINYRKQWSWLQNSFRNQSISGEAGFAPDKQHFNRLGTSLIVLQDQAGSSQLKRFEARGNVAWHQPVTSKDVFSSGIGFGYIQRSIVWDGLKWDAQYNGAGYDPSLDNKENLNTNAVSHIDFSLGLFWTHRARKSEWNCGLSSYHYMQDQSLIEESMSPLQLRHTILGSYTKRTSYFDYVADLKIKRQAGAMEIELGGRVHYKLGMDSRYTNFRTSSTAFFGVYYRHADAITPLLGFEFERLVSLFVSYDVTISELAATGGRGGALEFTLLYKGNFSGNRKMLERQK